MTEGLLRLQARNFSIPLVQSSGTGKSRLLNEVTRYRVGCVLNLREQLGSDGMPGQDLLHYVDLSVLTPSQRIPILTAKSEITLPFSALCLCDSSPRSPSLSGKA
jgi:hypothetical protein